MLQDSATPKMVRNVIDGTTPPQKVVGSYEQLEDGTYNLVIGVTGDAPSAAAISQINGEDLAGKEFYDYVRTEGAVLFSFNPDFSPAALYGGSWEKVTDRFLVGAGGSYTLGSTGGNATHTNTVEEMVPHYHYQRATSASPASGWYSERLVSGGTGHDQPQVDLPIMTSSTGGGQPFSILPPYLAVNIWHRVA